MGRNAIAALTTHISSSAPDVGLLQDESHEGLCLPGQLIDAEWVRAGTHVTSVGYAPPRGELTVELLDRAHLFVESLEAFEPPPVGCGELHGIDPGIATTLGDMLAQLKDGRRGEADITVYKAMGVAMEDMIAADIAYRHAKAAKTGQIIAL